MKHYDNTLREKTYSLLIVYVSFHRKNNPERPSGMIKHVFSPYYRHTEFEVPKLEPNGLKCH